MSQGGLGRVFNTVFTASGALVPLTRASAVSYVVAHPGTGTATLTFTQQDSTGVKSPINLNIGTQTAGSENLGSLWNVGPDTGGTWTLTAATSANVFTLGGATNDAGVVTVRAEQLADGYDTVVATASAGATTFCVALLHDLLVQRKPANLRSSLTA